MSGFWAATGREPFSIPMHSRLFRAIALGEHLKIQFQAEAFGGTNTPQSPIRRHSVQCELRQWYGDQFERLRYHQFRERERQIRFALKLFF